MWKLIKDNKFFFSILLVFWMLCLVLLFSKTKAELHMLLNSNHSKFFDDFFFYLTELGAWFPFVVAVLLLFYRFGAALIVLVPQLLVALPIYAIKQFYDAPRPIAFFVQEQFVKLEVVGVDYHGTNSFPSGHTTSAFALFLSLAVLFKHPLLKLLFVFLAIGVGYSRIYLSQHFAGDVFGGSIIGSLFCFVYIYMQQKYARPWMDKSLLTAFKK